MGRFHLLNIRTALHITICGLAIIGGRVNAVCLSLRNCGVLAVALTTVCALPSALALLVATPAVAGVWNATTSMNLPRGYVATTQYNGYIYATGGANEDLGYLNSVEFSRIQADGSLGPWVNTTSMLGPHASHATVSANGIVYVLGGGPTLQSLVTVEAAPINLDGTLGSWNSVGTLLSTGRYQHAAAVANGHVYAVGGSPAGGGCLNTVERAAINADGSLGSFEYVSPLNVCHIGLRAIAANGYLYAVGGDTTSGNVVERALINSDGSLGPWQYVSSLSSPRTFFGAELALGRIYAFSGPNPPEITSEEFSVVAADGSLSSWASTSTPLSTLLSRFNGGSATDGTHLFWIGGYHFNGTNSLSSNYVEYQTLGSTAPLANTHDFNGDGKSDIVWQYASSGDTSIWLMNGAQILSTPGFGAVPTIWFIYGQRDFDGDGKADLLWRDNMGNTAIWFMNGSVVKSTAAVGNIPNTFGVVGVGDFNGDGLGDLLWVDTNGNYSVWLMNGATVLSAVFLGNVPLEFSVVGVGDFNGDGDSDILWRDVNNGNTSIWFMNGTQVSSSGAVGNIPTNWSVVGTGDFNGDGMADIAWRDTAGDTSIWLMSGAAVLSAAGLGNVPTNWSIVQTGDYNGDGMSDLLWRNTAPNGGDTSIWFMNGTTIASTGGVGVIPTGWIVQSVNAE